MRDSYAHAYPHEPIKQLFDHIYWVHGSIKMGPCMYMNRNMVIVKDEDSVYLINPIRLNCQEEQKLLAMGSIKAIIRLGDFHGLDDQYYLDRYKCQLWCQPGQVTYPVEQPDFVIEDGICPPFGGAEFFIFSKAKFPEAALYFRDKKLLITTDSVQYWEDWQHMNGLGKVVLWCMGFRVGLFIGKPWLKRVSPDGGSLKSDFDSLLELDFEHLLAAHGKPLSYRTKEQLREIIARQFEE